MKTQTVCLANDIRVLSPSETRAYKNISVCVLLHVCLCKVTIDRKIQSVTNNERAQARDRKIETIRGKCPQPWPRRVLSLVPQTNHLRYAALTARRVCEPIACF